MIEAQQVAHDARRTAEASWERQAHHQRFEEGALVWLEGRNIHTSHPTAKLAPKRYGPFPITKVLGPVTYQLQLPEQWTIHPVFHADLLTPYKETEFHGRNFERPLPDLIDGEEEYEVEHIVNSRRFGRRHQVQYLVHWKGYPEADDQWIPWSDLNTPGLLTEFQKENPDAVTHIRTTRVDDEDSVPLSLPPTSLPLTLYPLVYMSDGSATLPQGSAQGRGGSLSLYEAAAAEVGNNNDGSAIIRRIMAISQAAADVHAAEVGEREEADRCRSQRDDAVNKITGSDDGRTVLAGVHAQPGVDHAPTNRQRGQTLRPLLVPAEAYPPSGSAGSPIDVDSDEYHTPEIVGPFDRRSPVSLPDSSTASYDLNFFESHATT